MLLSIAICAAFVHAPAHAGPIVPQRLGEPFEEHLVPVDGGQLCCVVRPGDGPILMLIPGTFSDSRAFGRMVPHLDSSVHLLIVENRGLGRSGPPPENGSIEQCARDALHVADHLGARQFYVGGHSLGGMIAIELAGVAPERLRGVISIEGWSHWHAARDAFGNDMKSTLTDEEREELAAYRAEVLRNWSDEQRENFAQVWKQWDGEPVLKATSLPVLELYGDRARQRPAQELLRVPRRDNIVLLWFAGASHSLPYERPEQVGNAINAFIARSANPMERN